MLFHVFFEFSPRKKRLSPSRPPVPADFVRHHPVLQRARGGRIPGRRLGGAGFGDPLCLHRRGPGPLLEQTGLGRAADPLQSAEFLDLLDRLSAWLFCVWELGAVVGL